MRGNLDLVAGAAGELGLEFRVDTWSKIYKCLELIDKYRDALNLTGGGSWAGLELHAAEALTAVAAAERARPGSGGWLDVGSGGGFPGLIVACVWAGPVTLVEPRAKRAAFLEMVVASVDSGALVRRARLEHGICHPFDGGPALVGGADIASARAVFSAARWAEEAPRWLRPGGIWLLHSRQSEVLPAGAVSSASWGGWQVGAYVSRGT